MGGGDDDGRSVATVVLHYLERVDEEDKEQMAKQYRVCSLDICLSGSKTTNPVRSTHPGLSLPQPAYQN